MANNKKNKINCKVMIKRAAALLLSLLILMSFISCGNGKCNDKQKEGKFDLGEMSKYINTEADEYRVLVNKQNTAPKSYVPSDLRKIDSEYSVRSLELREYACFAVEAMMSELHKAGFTDILVTSAFRDYEYQASLFERYTESEMEKDKTLTRAEAEKIVLTYSAFPGTSEHQTGLCVDLVNKNRQTLDESFANEPAYQWLIENAHNFGFVLRFPEGKENVTGYNYEPWHYRFVGAKLAGILHDKGLTLEEYYQ